MRLAVRSDSSLSLEALRRRVSQSDEGVASVGDKDAVEMGGDG